MTTKTNRSIKVYGQSGYRYRETPTILLKGKWLAEFGFEIGEHVLVSCEDGKLVITPDTERAALEKAEQEFIERETETLRKRFKKEQGVAYICPEELDHTGEPFLRHRYKSQIAKLKTW